MKETAPAYCRHDLSDATWALLEPHLPGREGGLGRYCPGQSPVYRCGVLDFADGRTVA